MVQKKPNPSTQIPVITCLRGIAALLVCIFHFNYVTNQTILSITELGKLGVPIFFVISGVVIPLAMIKSNYQFRDWKTFFAKRLARIEPAYLASLAIVLIFYYLRRYFPGSPQDSMPSGRDILLHFGYLIPFVDNAHWFLGVYWTLGIELQFYLSLSLIMPFILKGQQWSRYFLYALFITMPLFSLSDNRFLLLHGPIFLIGISYTFSITGVSRLQEHWIVSLIAISMAAFTQPAGHVIATVSSILIIANFANFTNRILVFFGTISYSLYLIHQCVGSALVNFLSHKFRQPWQMPLVITSGLLVSILAAYCLYVLVEKPSHSWSKRIKYSSQNNSMSHKLTPI